MVWAVSLRCHIPYEHPQGPRVGLGPDCNYLSRVLWGEHMAGDSWGGRDPTLFIINFSVDWTRKYEGIEPSNHMNYAFQNHKFWKKYSCCKVVLTLSQSFKSVHTNVWTPSSQTSIKLENSKSLTVNMRENTKYLDFLKLCCSFCFILVP